MPISRLKKLRNWFYFLLIMGGFPLLIWAGYSSTTEAYKYWKHGVEKPAKVVSLDHTGGSARGGTNHYYELEIDGRSIVERFRVRLPVGKTVSVLTLVDEPDKVVFGTKESTWFDLYSYGIGGQFMGTLTLAMFAFMTIFGPWVFVQFIKARHAILDQE